MTSPEGGGLLGGSGFPHAFGDTPDGTDASAACTRESCLDAAAAVFAAGLREQSECVAAEGVAAAARAAGCVTEAEIAGWAARFFPDALLDVRGAA